MKFIICYCFMRKPSLFKYAKQINNSLHFDFHKTLLKRFIRCTF